MKCCLLGKCLKDSLPGLESEAARQRYPVTTMYPTSDSRHENRCSTSMTMSVQCGPSPVTWLFSDVLVITFPSRHQPAFGLESSHLYLLPAKASALVCHVCGESSRALKWMCSQILYMNSMADYLLSSSDGWTVLISGSGSSVYVLLCISQVH